MDLNRNKPLIALSNLNKEILQVLKIDVNIHDEKPLIIEKMTTGMNALLKGQGFTVEELGVITIAIPGVIDEDTGKIFANPQFNLWSKLNLKSILSEIYGVPVLMKNDISMAALGEKYFGCGKSYKYMAYVSAGLGVGAGIILNNKLYEGPRKAAGEIGYMKLSNQEGNLENQLSTLKIFNKIQKDIDDGLETVLSNKIKERSLSVEMINEGIQENDPYSKSLIESLARLMGSAVGNMALVLDLELIVMGGTLGELDGVFLDQIRATVDEMLPFSIEIVNSKLKSMAGIYGLIELGEGYIMKEIVI
jgi:predicted NBD/HSP70 family sugar kinase